MAIPHMARPRPLNAPTRLTGTGIYAALRAARIAEALRPDAVIMLIVFALVILGLVMVQSASAFVNPLDPGALARRELLWAALGGLGLALTTHVDYHLWRRLAWPAVALALALLGLVVPLGLSVGGAQRWLRLGSWLTFQPSEVAKLAFVLFAAHWLTAGPARFGPRHLFIYGAVAGTNVGLVLWQNDLGTALVLAGSAVVLVFAAGAPWRWLLAGSALASVVGAAVIASTPFRRARLTAFLHPLACGTDGPSHHICQSLLALGSGGLTGQGLGQGVAQSGYLPAPYTDSIAAVIGEELGFVGELALILALGVLLWRGWRVARRAPDSFGGLLALGITCWIAVQALLNLGSSVAAVPFTGVPLPFVSFGGSSLLVLLAAVGVLLNISAQGNGHSAQRSPERSAPGA